MKVLEVSPAVHALVKGLVPEDRKMRQFNDELVMIGLKVKRLIPSEESSTVQP